MQNSPIDANERSEPLTGNALGRDRRLLGAVTSAIISKGVLVLVSALSIPIVIRSLGAESFGVWSTISTFLAMLLMFDLGVANSLTNFISEAYAREDREHASRYSSTALFITATIAVVLGVIARCAWSHLDWFEIFHLSSRALAAEVSRAVGFALAIFLIDLPARLATKILGGYQQLWIANIFSAVGGASSLLSLVVLASMRAGLSALVIGSTGALVGSDVLCLLWIILIHKPWLRPRLNHFDKSAGYRMIRLGSEFFMLQVAGLIVFNTDNLIVAHYLGAAQVAPYSITWRLVGFAAIFQTLLSPALWPAFTEAFERHDLPWVRITFRRTMWITMGVAGGFAVIFAAAGRWLIAMWGTRAAVPPESLLLLMCAWVVISTFMNNTSTVLASSGQTRIQAWLGLFAAVLNLGLSIYLVKRMGANGVILGTILSYAVVLIVPQTILARNVLRGGRAGTISSSEMLV